MLQDKMKVNMFNYFGYLGHCDIPQFPLLFSSVTFKHVVLVNYGGKRSVSGCIFVNCDVIHTGENNLFYPNRLIRQNSMSSTIPVGGLCFVDETTQTCRDLEPH